VATQPPVKLQMLFPDAMSFQTSSCIGSSKHLAIRLIRSASQKTRELPDQSERIICNRIRKDG
jgi:hypothetical protein